MARGSATIKLIRLCSSKSFLFRASFNFPSNYSQYFLSSCYNCRFYSGFDPPKSHLFELRKLNDLYFCDNYAKLGWNLLKKQPFSSGEKGKSESDLDGGDGVGLECNGLKKEPVSSTGGNDKADYDLDVGAGAGVELECNGLTSVGLGNVAFREPVEIYKELRDAWKSYKETREEWDTLSEIFDCFSKSGWASNQALAVYSGKTYNALQRFMEANKGIYCSPLRLLAMEVFDKVNAAGVYCSLLTGQEKKKVPFSSHIACTVEMASTEELYEVAVIDEIQMMADPRRGYAWTRAFLGLKADEIHLCGDPSVLNIVRKICSETGDELVEQRYERFKKLVVEAKTLLGDLRNVRSGDCVVAFSRREIFEVKLAIEKYTKHRCCVIYGALPPETRRMQANLFNDQDNEYDILVASDAVGMGLNLNIRRVVFYTLSKYNGDKIVPVAASQVKQIAGRAGRRGSRYPDGLTTTLQLDDLDYLISCLQKPFDVVTKVGLFPFFEQVELFAGQLPQITFAKLLEKFSESCRMDGSYFLCNHTNIKKVANMLEKVQGISLEDRFNFCFAPVNIRDPKAMYHLLRYASAFAKNLPVGIAMGMPMCSARNDTELLDLETKHQVLSMYLWLSNHFNEETFPYVKKAQDMATDIADLLGQSLLNANWKPESRNAGNSKRKEKKENKNGYERPRSLVMSKEKKRHQMHSESQDNVGA